MTVSSPRAVGILKKKAYIAIVRPITNYLLLIADSYFCCLASFFVDTPYFKKISPPVFLGCRMHTMMSDKKKKNKSPFDHFWDLATGGLISNGSDVELTPNAKAGKRPKTNRKDRKSSTKPKSKVSSKKDEYSSTESSH